MLRRITTLLGDMLNLRGRNVWPRRYGRRQTPTVLGHRGMARTGSMSTVFQQYVDVLYTVYGFLIF